MLEYKVFCIFSLLLFFVNIGFSEFNYTINDSLTEEYLKYYSAIENASSDKLENIGKCSGLLCFIRETLDYNMTQYINLLIIFMFLVIFMSLSVSTQLDKYTITMISCLTTGIVSLFLWMVGLANIYLIILFAFGFMVSMYLSVNG